MMEKFNRMLKFN
jgi:hypothetical protein